MTPERDDLGRDEPERDEQIADALSSYARSVDADPEGWNRIVDRLDAPRRWPSPKWIISGVAVASLAAVVLFFALGSSNGDDDQVTQVANDVGAHGDILAVTDDARLVELDRAGNAVREVTQLGAGSEDPDVLPFEALDLQVAPSGTTAYVQHSAMQPWIACTAGSIAPPARSWLEVDLTDGSVEPVDDAYLVAVSPDGTVLKVRTYHEAESTCSTSIELAIVRPDGDEEAMIWPADAPAPTDVSWIDDERLLVTSSDGQRTTFTAVTYASDRDSWVSFDLAYGAIAAPSGAGGIVVAGGASDWPVPAGFDHGVVHLPSVPVTEEAAAQPDVVQYLFNYDLDQRPRSLSARLGGRAALEQEVGELYDLEVLLVTGPSDAAGAPGGLVLWPAGAETEVIAEGIQAAAWLSPSSD